MSNQHESGSSNLPATQAPNPNPPENIPEDDIADAMAIDNLYPSEAYENIFGYNFPLNDQGKATTKKIIQDNAKLGIDTYNYEGYHKQLEIVVPNNIKKAIDKFAEKAARISCMISNLKDKQGQWLKEHSRGIYPPSVTNAIKTPLEDNPEVNALLQSTRKQLFKTLTKDMTDKISRLKEDYRNVTDELLLTLKEICPQTGLFEVKMDLALFRYQPHYLYFLCKTADTLTAFKAKQLYDKIAKKEKAKKFEEMKNKKFQEANTNATIADIKKINNATIAEIKKLVNSKDAKTKPKSKNSKGPVVKGQKTTQQKKTQEKKKKELKPNKGKEKENVKKSGKQERKRQ